MRLKCLFIVINYMHSYSDYLDLLKFITDQLKPLNNKDIVIFNVKKNDYEKFILQSRNLVIQKVKIVLDAINIKNRNTT